MGERYRNEVTNCILLARRRNAPFDCRFTVGRPGPDADRCSPMPTEAMFAIPRNPDFCTRHELGLRWPHAARKGR